MARDLFDTDTLIDISKHIEPVMSRARIMFDSADEVGVCPVQLTGFFSWPRPEHRREWEQFFQGLKLWGISQEIAVQAGVYRYDFARRGRHLSAMDCTTAAVARERSAIVVTSNVKDFPMTDVQVLSLRREEIS